MGKETQLWPPQATIHQHIVDGMTIGMMNLSSMRPCSELLMCWLRPLRLGFGLGFFELVVLSLAGC